MSGTVLYLATFAVWLVLIGAALNRAPLHTLVVLGVGAVTGVLAIVFDNAWFLVPVVTCWLLGIGLLLREERRRR